jgi:hypothetical protein
MRVDFIKKHVGGMVGDTTKKSRLYNDFMLQHINWGGMEILDTIAKRGKDAPFTRGVFTIDITTAGTGGDYALPFDFSSVINVSGTNAADALWSFNGLDNKTHDDLSQVALQDQNAYAVFYDTQAKRWRLRLYLISYNGLETVTVTYKRKFVEVTSDADEITIFPEGEGWDLVLVYAAASLSYGFNQENFAVDPRPRYKELLEDKIEAMNAKTPDDHGGMVPRSEHDKFYGRLALEGQAGSGYRFR